jgi:gamma-glutamyltranspeptidase/glutathione hydrolase
MPAPIVAGAAPPLRCAVASPHALATQAARDVFRNGGNAIDAALTAATVVYLHNTALGGDLIALCACSVAVATFRRYRWSGSKSDRRLNYESFE